MTKDDILKLARESYERGQSDLMEACKEAAAKAIESAILAEREACAKVAEQFGPNRPIVAERPSERIVGRWEGEQAASSSIAAAIRARSNP
jgi:hypothetical protein